MNTRSLGALACLALAASSCEEYGLPAGPSPHREMNFLDMGDQPKIKAQRGDLLGGPEFGTVEGTIPRGFEPYRFHGRPEAAEASLVNPLRPGDPAATERGKMLFERNCVPCHGDKAAGDGTVVKKGFPPPPSLMTEKVRQWKDGRIYHTITEGQNIMPSYATQVRQEDRWAIVHYVRKLQSELPVAPPAPGAAPAAPSGSAPVPAPASSQEGR
jgi:mono/diheme cytochrome c family protein